MSDVLSIRIRRVEPGDYAALRKIHDQPRAIRGTLQLPFPSEDLWRKRMAEPSENHTVLLACVEEELVGCISMQLMNALRRRHVGTIGMAVHDDWQGRGVGTALLKAVIDIADRWLNLSRLELNVFTDNADAIRLYEKFGFRIEGTHAKYAFTDGQFVDAHTMARVR